MGDVTAARDPREPARAGAAPATDDDGSALTLSVTRREVARYVYCPQVPAEESPRPYLHPVRTLGGTPVTDFRPADHRWHHGLSLALAHVGETNLWGGTTWVGAERAYRPLPVNGTMRHERFAAIDDDGFVEQLRWHDALGRVIATERREVRFGLRADAWWLRWHSQVRNAAGLDLAFGSPATHGRDGAGYGGIFLRAAPLFHGGAVCVPAGSPAHGEDRRGVVSPAMALTAAAGTACVVISVPGGRAAWFARTKQYPGFGPAPFFATELVLPPGGTTEFACDVLVADDRPADLSTAGWR